MPVLFKYTEPLLGVWKIEESSEELLSMLEQTSEYLPFLQQIKTEILIPEYFPYEWLCGSVVAGAGGCWYRYRIPFRPGIKDT